MEIGENVESKSIIHPVQSVPILSSSADSSQSDGDKEKGKRKLSKNRRVSFASSQQLAQYLEPINPFDSLGKLHLWTHGPQTIIEQQNFCWSSVILHCVSQVFILMYFQ